MVACCDIISKLHMSMNYFSGLTYILYPLFSFRHYPVPALGCCLSYTIKVHVFNELFKYHRRAAQFVAGKIGKEKEILMITHQM